MSWISVDIDLDEVLNSLSSKDVKYLIENLIADGHLDPKVLDESKPKHFDELEWIDHIERLKVGRHRLTSEDEQTILNISKKLN
jgi:hypothetical protein